MLLAWATDVHLNFCSEDAARRGLVEPTLRAGAAGLILTGDIAEAPSLSGWLRFLTAQLGGLPLYFVLGNHDAYRGSLAQARADAAGASPPARWLGDGAVIPLGEDAALIGHGGWGDARLGDFLATPVRINDHRLIAELALEDRVALQARLRALGDEAAASLRRSLTAALRGGARRVLVATHVPPFREACWHAGAQPPLDSPWLPDFTCAATGAVLREVAAANPATEIVVLCGHSHGSGRHQAADNLVVHTGGAEYGQPCLAGLIDDGLRLLPAAG